jgi:large subunit ribosomal protein L6
MSEAQAQVASPAAAKLSRVGKRPVVLPKGVKVNVGATSIDVQGPKGKLSMAIPAQVAVKSEGEQILVTSSATGRDASRLQGLARALLASMVKGAAEGYEKTLELQGTGYRAEIKGKAIHLQLGFSHPCVFPLPESVTANIPADSKGTIIQLASPNKGLLGQVAASIKALRPAEPYGGKGVWYKGETIRRKAGKAGKGRK